MIRRFFRWIRSFFASSTTQSELDSFLPTAPVEKTKKAEIFSQDCVCGCGERMQVPRGTLRFFASKDCRKRYRRVHVAINYASAR